MTVKPFFFFVFGTALGALGCGIRLLDYRRVDEGVYDTTRFFTLLFLPTFPLTTWRIRPHTAQSVNLGAVVEAQYNFELLEEISTPGSRIIRMYLFAWILFPILLAGPLAGALVFAKTHAGGAPSTFKTLVLLASIVWGLVILGLLNHRREKLYSWTN